ncbi:hypothetical protein KY330_02420 [Candidatus Woesearchaeota archaeon]|nr:hypothetical protein [Candidatus Woesearchaeota archaeon]
MKKLLILLVIGLFILGCAKDEVVVPDEDLTPPGVPEPGAPAPDMGEDVADDTVAEEPAADLEPAIVDIISAVLIQPFELKVKVGQEVIWMNKHVEGKRDRSWQIIGDKNDPFESELVKVGDYYSHTYTKPGTYSYVIAPGSAGKIVVEE